MKEIENDKNHDPKIEKYLLFLLLFINLISIFGYFIFSLHPDSLARWPWSVPIFAMSYPFFARLQILTSFAALVVALVRATRFRWVKSFFVLITISAMSEMLGTHFGFPFGKYSYTSFLGPKILDHVPWLIPLSWFFMAVPSFALTRLLMGNRANPLIRILAAASFLLFWDITLDPAMSHLATFWIWEHPGNYYGMPMSNLMGWFITGCALMIFLEKREAQEWLSCVSSPFLIKLYLVNLVLPFGMCIAAGVWAPVLVSLVMGTSLALALSSKASRQAVSNTST